MKETMIVLALVSLTACAAKEDKPFPPIIGMANPASVYCQKVGGKLDIVKSAQGDIGYCALPSGERVEEWALFRRDHPTG